MLPPRFSLVFCPFSPNGIFPEIFRFFFLERIFLTAPPREDSPWSFFVGLFFRKNFSASFIRFFRGVILLIVLRGGSPQGFFGGYIFRGYFFRKILWGEYFQEVHPGVLFKRFFQAYLISGIFLRVSPVFFFSERLERIFWWFCPDFFSGGKSFRG